jgi:alpha-tubulin suppressor-like RCC1 family protein
VLGLDRGVTAITAGADHTCAAMQGGGAMCWGGNAYGDLGIGEYGSAFTATDVVNLTEEVLFLAADGYYTDYDQAYGHTCAALASGQVKCWGVNWGSGDYSLSPVIIGGLTGTMLALEAGDTFTCAVTSGGKVKCWGRNDYGQLGDGTMIDRNLPADVIGLESNVSGLGLGDLYACVVTELGNIYCWGGSFNRLGTGDSAFRPVPLPLKGLAEEASQLAAGFRQACVVSEAGGVKCWGWNWGPMPSQVSGLTSGVLAISVSSEYPVGYGSRSACAVMETGSLECWDGIGQPYSLDDLFDEAVTAVAVASRHKCALTINGGVKCWGKNEYGQLGDGTTEERISPVDVSGLTSGVAAIATGGWQSCALLESGQVKCWGNNDSGQLGDGTDKNRVLPVDVIGLSSGVAAITSGDEHTCALIESGGVKCWGNNDYGQLGDGTTNSRLTPVDVIGLTSGVQSISAGYQHTCALMGNGGVKCWGNNSHSQLGDGTTSMHLVPTDVRGLTANVIALEASGNFTCAILTSRGVKCWGENSFGQLSQGTANIQLWPAPVLSTRIYVALNENIGRPGSYFTVWGEGFPPYRLASVIVNGTVLTDTLQTGTTGSFIFFLDTAGADTGAYNVTVTAEMNTAASFILLEEQADLRPQEGGGIILPLHAGIVQPADLHFLPFVRR